MMIKKLYPVCRRPDLKKRFRKGSLVSVWIQPTRRHKWYPIYSFAKLRKIDEFGATLQVSDSFVRFRFSNFRTGPVSFAFGWQGSAQRHELREPFFDPLPVK